jgi:hypothetical protein
MPTAMREQPKFLFFVATPVRDLTIEEREVVLKLLESADRHYVSQVAELRVVGRCGCGRCPTVFFAFHESGVQESDLSTYAGTDVQGGLTAAVLLQKQGRLSQLEFYSIDGHDPWFAPKACDLQPYV